MSLRSRLANVFRGDRLRDEIDEELASHIDHAVADGRDAVDARRAFGSPLRHREESRDARVVGWLSDALQDLRVGFRMLRRSPAFSILAVLCLTLGIGGTPAVCSWIEGILFRPYPLVADQDRLVAIAGTNPGAERAGASWPDWLDPQRGSTPVQAFPCGKNTGADPSVR